MTSHPHLAEPNEAYKQHRHPSRFQRSQQSLESCHQTNTALHNDSETKSLPRPPPVDVPSVTIKFRTSLFSKYKQCVIRPMPAKPRPKRTKTSETPSSANDASNPPPSLIERAQLEKDRKCPRGHAEGQNLQTDLSLSRYLAQETDWSVSKEMRTDLGRSVPPCTGKSSLEDTWPWEGAEIGVPDSAGRRPRQRRCSQLGRRGSSRRRRKSVAGAAHRL